MRCCNFIIIHKLGDKQDNVNALPRWPCWGLIANSSLSIRTRNWLLKGKEHAKEQMAASMLPIVCRGTNIPGHLLEQ